MSPLKAVSLSQMWSQRHNTLLLAWKMEEGRHNLRDAGGLYKLEKARKQIFL
jgi:hypothetical protein